MRRRFLTAFLLTLLVPPGYSQSLGEAAAREKARRSKQGPSSARVITDEDLKASRPPGQAGQQADSGSATSSTTTSSTTREGSTSGEGRSSRPSVREGESASSSGGDATVWRERAQAQRGAIAAAEKRIQDSQDRLARLMADREPVALGDPNRLQTIERMKAETRQALERAQLDLADAQKGLQDLEDEARRNNVPPGWLR
jgi:hypothetical protein